MFRLRRYTKQTYETDGYRLDAAGLNENGEVVVAVEAERSNHDTLCPVPKDFDKMAAYGPEAAIRWSRTARGPHNVLEAPNDPPEGRHASRRSTTAIRCRKYGLSTRWGRPRS